MHPPLIAFCVPPSPLRIWLVSPCLLPVPLYYSMLLFRNKAELQDLRNLELSISTEGSRIKLGSRLRGKERREYQSEIDEATERKSVLEEQYEGRRARLPVSLRKLTNGYEMRTYWFEVFECVRKILLILIPIFFEQDSPEQLTVGLIICFITWGAYMVCAPARPMLSPPLSLRPRHSLCQGPTHILTGLSVLNPPALRCWQMFAPFEAYEDDVLSQVCQLQIFFSLLSSIILKARANSPFMETLLPILVAVPPALAGIFETGVLDEIYNIDLTCGGRVGVGWGAKCFAFLERCLRVKQPVYPVEDDEGGGNDDHEHVSTTRSGPTSLFQESASASLDLRWARGRSSG